MISLRLVWGGIIILRGRSAGCHLDRAQRREIQPGLKILSPYGAERSLRGYRCANNEIQGGHAGPPLSQDGIVWHGPTYGTMRSRWEYDWV